MTIIAAASADLRPTFVSGLYFQTKPSTCGLIPILVIRLNDIHIRIDLPLSLFPHRGSWDGMINSATAMTTAGLASRMYLQGGLTDVAKPRSHVEHNGCLRIRLHCLLYAFCTK